MAGKTFNDRLTEQRIPLEQILLDPNNPRLIGIDDFFGVPEQRIGEPDVQDTTLARLNGLRAIDQESLRASIQQSGLMPVDRIVVRPIPSPESAEAETRAGGAGATADTPPTQLFVVVEGNRRIAACKTLYRQHQVGEKTLEDSVLESIETPGVLVLTDGSAEEARLDQWVIQGVRHISGIRPWGAYQAAKTIEAMLEQLKYTELEVANALSISVQRVKRSMRVLAAITQMSESDDYSEYATPEYYAYFDEVLKRPAIRNWLSWNNESMSFENDDRLEMLYSWITPDDELDGRRRIPVAESVRRLDLVIEDGAAIDMLNTPGNTIEEAVIVAAPAAAPDWSDPLHKALRALDSVPIGDLENLSPEDRATLEALVVLTQKRLRQADAFKA